MRYAIVSFPRARDADIQRRMRRRTAAKLERDDVLRGALRTPLVGPAGSRSTHALGQVKNGPLARFLFGGEGGIRTRVRVLP